MTVWLLGIIKYSSKFLVLVTVSPFFHSHFLLILVLFSFLFMRWKSSTVLLILLTVLYSFLKSLSFFIIILFFHILTRFSFSHFMFSHQNFLPLAPFHTLPFLYFFPPFASTNLALPTAGLPEGGRCDRARQRDKAPHLFRCVKGVTRWLADNCWFEMCVYAIRIMTS